MNCQDLFSVIFDSVEIFDDFICRWDGVILTMLSASQPASLQQTEAHQERNKSIKSQPRKKECRTSDRSIPSQATRWPPHLLCFGRLSLIYFWIVMFSDNPCVGSSY